MIDKVISIFRDPLFANLVSFITLAVTFYFLVRARQLERRFQFLATVEERLAQLKKSSDKLVNSIKKMDFNNLAEDLEQLTTTQTKIRGLYDVLPRSIKSNVKKGKKTIDEILNREIAEDDAWEFHRTLQSIITSVQDDYNLLKWRQ